MEANSKIDNLNRQALLLAGTLITGRWFDLVPIRFVTFQEIGLATDSSDTL